MKNCCMVGVVLVISFLYMDFSTMGRCRTATEIWDHLRRVENSTGQSTEIKQREILSLKSEFEKCKLPADSVYARILHRIALYDYLINDNNPTSRSIAYTLEAVRVNTLHNRSSSEKFAVNSYSNLAMYYKDLRLYDKALSYYDTTMLLVAQHPDQKRFLLSSRNDRSNIFYHTGNYQRSIDESYSGFLESKNISDTTWMIRFLNQMAQSHFFQNQLSEGVVAADQAIAFLNSQLKQHKSKTNQTQAKTDVSLEYYELATALKTKALIYEQLGERFLAERLFEQTIVTRLQSSVENTLGQVADDYTDFGNFYLNTVKAFEKANACYFKTLEYAEKTGDRERSAKAYLSLGQSWYQRHNLKLAKSAYLKSINQLVPVSYTDFLQQPASVQLNKIVNSEFILVYLRNRIELLLTEFKKASSPEYLERAVETALLADTLITRFRHEQTAEESKIFWRTYTRGIYSMAMEAAFLKSDPDIAFFFMEKSRAVLLNDKLNELGSFAYLPPNEAVKEQQLRTKILDQQAVVSLRSREGIIDDSSERNLLEAKESLLRYIQSLEQKYPAYYQYKYSDSVPSLDDLKKYLSANKQSFVHYFISDTVGYALSISTNGARMSRIDSSDFRSDEIPALLAFFSNKQLLNNQYSNFASQSYRFYKKLFEPLQLPEGRVVICPDNFLLPFEGLSSNESGTRMLIEDYAFTYIYSARYLLKQFPQHPARGHFLGFAPVSFRPYLQLADLKSSAMSLEEVAKNYNKPLLFKKAKATRHHFLSSVASYNIVNIFSHARADEANEQPMLFMHDSVIKLSEFQYLNRPSTRLVVLSACQTTAGRNATGEGIYSLARGLAAAGIPSVAATIWKADEESTYAISKSFHHYLSRGLPLDVALQQAKLAYIQKATREQLLPYYWANMIVMGKVNPVTLEKSSSRLWYIAATGILSILIVLILLRRKEKRNHVG